MRILSAVVGVMLALSTAAPGCSQQASPSRLKATFSKLPINFVENRGVYPDEVAYSIQGADKTLFFTKSGVTFRLRGKDRGWVVKLEFVDGNPDVEPRGEDRQQAVFSYFKGPEKDWKTGLPSWSRIVYRDLWPGIDLVYRGTVNELKYEFLVAPGADPSRIRLRYQGATSVALTRAGALRVETPAGGFEDELPRAWQEVGGKRAPVEMAFRLDSDREDVGAEFGFRVGDYDRTRPLVLDPVILVHCGYIGGVDWDVGRSITVDPAGNTYVTGYTDSDQHTFPVTVGPVTTYSRGIPSTCDVFVAKLNARGTGLVYCGYIGGSGLEALPGIAVDRAGNAYVTGHTDSTEQTFPVKGGPDLTYNGSSDAFVAKVNAQGTGLVYCGYIGGNSMEYGSGIAVDTAGNAYVSGLTSSVEMTFPVTVGPDLTHNGGLDVFVAKVNAQGTGLVYCGYIGGILDEYGHGITLDAAGNAHVTGQTWSDERSFPVKVGPDLTYNSVNFPSTCDAFVAKVNARGTGLVYCGYIGGATDDRGYGIAVDAAGSAYVTGSTDSTEKTFPVKVGPDLTYNGGTYDAFVAKVNGQGTALAYCGYVGGTGEECGHGIAVDAAGNAYATGYTYTTELTFPVKIGPDLTFNGGTFDAFVAKVSASGFGLVYCGYIGGNGQDSGLGIAVDAAGNAYVTGNTRSDERTFPVTVGPDLTYNGGTFDAFVAKIALTLLQGSGTPRLGGILNLTLTATGDVGLSYQVGSSLGTGPIPVDSRRLNLGPDDLLAVSVHGLWPTIFSGFRGLIDTKGQARATVHIPNIPSLIGIRLHTAFVTLDPAAPSGIRSISNTFSFSITR